MTLRVTTPDVTRYHSSEIVDRFVPAEFLCAWIRYEFSKKLYIFLCIDDNDDSGTLRLLEGVDGTCLDKSLVHNSGQHSMTYKISGGIELSGGTSGDRFVYFSVYDHCWIDIIFWEYFVAHNSNFIKIKFRKIGDNYTGYFSSHFLDILVIFEYWFTRSGKCFG